MAAFLAVVAALCGSMFLLTRLLPETSPVRRSVEAAAQWIKANPRLFEKRLKLVAFALLISFFMALTLIYS
ncbi:hypothetical protein [Mitsuaria sp. GD03876]|uniref:hypothetical protein n=1 Tax=Mitsuaria sp. GD03876 TaxID=2975399 RepID=UPI002449E65B|nr:hypothetical protein [Mitsuaria sp. GD03876]MDH0865153.1 hypothetical protein [Mitsuaria sp. GD03876]